MHVAAKKAPEILSSHYLRRTSPHLNSAGPCLFSQRRGDDDTNHPSVTQRHYPRSGEYPIGNS
jgi:hypothetical protein